MEKRGQSAIEFLMSYGWAVLIVVGLIAALWLLGVFSGEIPTQCEIFGEFSCTDAMVGENTLILNLRPGRVENAKIISVDVNGELCAIEEKELVAKQNNLVECTGLDLKFEEKVAVIFEVEYQKLDSTIVHTIEGSISGQAVEESRVQEELEG